MYYKEKKQEIFLKNGKFEQKRDGRRIGTRWKGLGGGATAVSSTICWVEGAEGGE